MRKFRFAFIILFLFILLAIFLVMNSRKGNMYQKSNDFAISDTSNVTKIYLADKMNNTVKLTKVYGNEWKLNEKYAASDEMVKTMLRTLITLDVKAPVSKNARNNIIRLMASRSVKVEIYQKVYRINLFDRIKLFPHEKRTKTYYVGNATQDNMGTYMLMEDSEDPYVVFIPGFRGFVASRYTAIETDWRNHGIFNCKLPEIKAISVTYPDKPENSFIITNHNNRNFVVTALANNSTIQDFDTLKVIQYLGSFNKINFESFLTELAPRQVDSIVSSPPSILISLEDKKGKQYNLKGWRRKAEKGETDIEGNPVEWDRDRLIAKLEGSKELVTIQYFVFDPILRKLPWFLEKSTNVMGQ